jgi:CheY-like chemotaxis protein
MLTLVLTMMGSQNQSPDLVLVDVRVPQMRRLMMTGKMWTMTSWQLR